MTKNTKIVYNIKEVKIMKKILILCICIISIFLVSCYDSTPSNKLTLPDLTGKSREQIAEILDNK
jgi:protein involved in sex pheromone biosynthesis